MHFGPRRCISIAVIIFTVIAIAISGPKAPFRLFGGGAGSGEFDKGHGAGVRGVRSASLRWHGGLRWFPLT